MMPESRLEELERALELLTAKGITPAAVDVAAEIVRIRAEDSPTEGTP